MRLHFTKILTISLAIFYNSTCNATTQQISNDLSALAKQFTGRFLKKGYSQSEIYDALIYLKKHTDMAVYIYTFKKNEWIMIAFTPSKDTSTFAAWSKDFLVWLNKNVTKNIKEGLTFFYVPQEPIHDNGWLSYDQQIKIRDLFKECPILGTCTHPEVLWSENAILIPDPFILNPSYSANIDKLSKKITIPFQERKPSIFFRGALSGVYSSTLYNMENLSNDDRLILFIMSKNKPFIDAKITSDATLNNKNEVNPDFLKWYKQNLAERKSPSVDFITHAQNKYLISIDGFGAAWSRVPYILFTGSVLLLRAECRQYFYPLLTPMKTHINIDKGLTNLEAVYTYLENNPKIAESIGNSGRVLAENYLTQTSINTYLSHIIYDLNEGYKEPVGLKAKIILKFKQMHFMYAEFKYKIKKTIKQIIMIFFKI